MTTGADVVREARGWLDTPWQHQASLKGVATDCVGLVAGIGLSLGLPGWDRWPTDQPMHDYGFGGDVRRVLIACGKYLQVADADVRLGDVLWLRFDDSNHFALISCLDPARVIHAFSSIGRVAENGLDESWRKRIMRAYRYPGLT